MLLLAVVLRRLYRSRNDSTICLSTGAVGYVFIMIRADTGTSQPLLIATGLTYLAFHATYCKCVATNLSRGDGFLAITVVIATVLLAISAQFLSLTHLLVESSGFVGIWPFFPLHLITVFFASLMIRRTHDYIQSARGPEYILPLFERGAPSATTIVRAQPPAEGRQNVRLTSTTPAVS